MYIQAYKYNGVNNYLKNQQNVRFAVSFGNSSLITNEFSQLTKLGYPSKYLKNFIRNDLHSIEQAQILLELRLAGHNKRDILSSY